MDHDNQYCVKPLSQKLHIKLFSSHFLMEYSIFFYKFYSWKNCIQGLLITGRVTLKTCKSSQVRYQRSLPVKICTFFRVTLPVINRPWIKLFHEHEMIRFRVNIYTKLRNERIPFRQNFHIGYFHCPRSVKLQIFFSKKTFKKCILCKHSK